MGSFHLSSANSVSGQENFVSFSALWASAHPRFSFPAGFRQFRLRLRKNLGFFRLLPEISASQPGNSIPFPPGFCKFLPQCEIFFPPFPPIFSPLRGPFRTSKFVLFPACFPLKKKKNFLPFCPCPAFWALPHKNLGDFGQFFSNSGSTRAALPHPEQFHPPFPAAAMELNPFSHGNGPREEQPPGTHPGPPIPPPPGPF